MPKLLRDLKSFYRTQKRDLPWRRTRDPYKILVSEIMLQQTQVERVIPFYERFIKEFPTPKDLAKAPLSKVLLLWSGLGYNRRAKHLQEAAKILCKAGVSRGGVGVPFISPERGTPATHLPGVGPYTLRAVATFAYNKREVFLETNIRTVFIHYLFRSRRHLDSLIPDSEILPKVEEALEKSHMQPQDFYWALMDYGSYLKRQGIKLNIRSKHYTKQSKFKGSHRELRGKILRALLERPQTMDTLIDITDRAYTDVARVVASLSSEGMITIKNKKISIAV